MEVNNSNLSVKYLDKWAGADALFKREEKICGREKRFAATTAERTKYPPKHAA